LLIFYPPKNFLAAFMYLPPSEAPTPPITTFHIIDLVVGSSPKRAYSAATFYNAWSKHNQVFINLLSI